MTDRERDILAEAALILDREVNRKQFVIIQSKAGHTYLVVSPDHFANASIQADKEDKQV